MQKTRNTDLLLTTDFNRIADRAIEHHGAMQKPRELSAFLKILHARSPIRNVLEIGGMYGGTLWAWSHYVSGQSVCVDNFVLEGRLERADTKVCHVKADSTLDRTRQWVEGLMQANSPDKQDFDLIFIDGDHRYNAVWKDAKNWLPLLSKTGIIAFHDICHRWLPDHDMWRFWAELSDQRCHYEIYDPTAPWGGIGILLGSELEAIPQFVYPNPHPLVMPYQCAPQDCDKCNNSLKLGEDTRCVECAANN